MRIQDPKYIVSHFVRIIGNTGTLLAVCLLSGCTALSFLLSPGPFEKKTVPAYNLKQQQDRKVLIWVECPRSAGTDVDVPEKLALAVQFYLTERAKFDDENIILNPVNDSKILLVDPLKIARSLNAGYVLLIHVDRFEVDFLQVRDYYAGQLITRASLMDTELGTAVWPPQPEGKMIHISVEMETAGREALVSRLISAATHCTLRYLYPCDKLKFKDSDERVSIQEAYEIETY